MKKPIVFIMQFFGTWPAWINFYIESCKANSDIDWVVFTDCGEPENKASNVRYVRTSFGEYAHMVSERLGFAFRPKDGYKLCDLRPALGHVHAQIIQDYEFFGYGDVDVIYGNIRRFYDDDTLSRFNVLSTHPERLSGHLALMRNTDQYRLAYRRIPDFQKMLQSDEHYSVDESHFSRLFLGETGNAFIERYSTPGRPWTDGSMSHPNRWIWNAGTLCDDAPKQREYMYLHFMIWHSRRWHEHLQGQGVEESGAWLKLDTPIKMDWRQASAQGFCISPDGIHEFARQARRSRWRPERFPAADLGRPLAALSGDDPTSISQGATRYRLRRLRPHGLIERVPKSFRYRVTDFGLRIALLFTRTLQHALSALTIQIGTTIRKPRWPNKI